ncbi:DNA damage-repair/toleration protein DRT102 [Fagus crenata]
MAESTTTTTTTPTTRPLKIIAGADSFGCDLKDTLISHLRSLNIEVEDLGTSSYYTIAAEVGVGVAIFANKFPGVFAATCLTPEEAQNARSINNSNVLAVSGMSTSPSSAIEILDTWLNTPFKSPCPASKSEPWPQKIESFLDTSLSEIPTIGPQFDSSSCSICCLVKNRELGPIDLIPGGSMKIVRGSPTSAIVRFKAGSVESAHHHTFGHDLVVLEGKKTKDVHRVKYYEDTEFFIKWDGKWDMFFDEDLEAAKIAIEKELGNGSV